jgi:hypothetical protein
MRRQWMLCFLPSAQRPQSRDPEGIEQDLVADQGQPFDLRLGNQHPVKRVAVCAGHQAGRPGVVDADGKMEKVPGIEDLGSGLSRAASCRIMRDRGFSERKTTA